MTMKPVAVFCSMLFLKLTLAEPCKDKTYNFLFKPACDVTEVLPIGFIVKNYTQPKACPSLETVCVSFPEAITGVEFSGTFPDTVTSIKIAGEGKMAELPIVYAPNIGKLVQFPVDGTLTYNEKISVSFTSKVAPIATCTGGDASNFISGTNGDCAAGKLCYALPKAHGAFIDIWGTIGNYKSIIVSDAGNANNDVPIAISLIWMKENSVSPTPLVLQLIKNTPVTGAKVMVPFVVATVANADTNPLLQEKPTCEGANPCYEIIGPTTATFQGKMPTNPVTITIFDDIQKNTYIFGSAGKTLKNELLAVMTTLLATRI